MTGEQQVRPVTAEMALAIPEPATFDVVQFEATLPELLTIVEHIPTIPQADEARARAAALEEYLVKRGIEAGPAMELARNIEARIGALLGDDPGRGKKEMSPHADSFHRQRRQEFRLMRRYRRVWEDKPRQPRAQILKAIERHLKKVIDVEASRHRRTNRTRRPDRRTLDDAVGLVHRPQPGYP